MRRGVVALLGGLVLAGGAAAAAALRPAPVSCDAPACTGSAASSVPRPIAVPHRRTVERVEAALAFWRDAAEIGLPGVAAADGRTWRVRVRKLACRPASGGVRCDYELRPCASGSTSNRERHWCPRERLFARGHGFASADGWYAVEPGG